MLDARKDRQTWHRKYGSPSSSVQKKQQLLLTKVNTGSVMLSDMQWVQKQLVNIKQTQLPYIKFCAICEEQIRPSCSSWNIKV